MGRTRNKKDAGRRGQIPTSRAAPPLLLLLILMVMAPALCAQIPIAHPISFTPLGNWGDLNLYGVSVCASQEAPISMYGNVIWAAAQKNGIKPRTNSQLEQYMRQHDRRSAAAWFRSTMLVASGLSTAAQAGGLLGQHWQDKYKAIAPAVGTVFVLAELVASRHAPPPLAIPPDYLPANITIPAGDCWIGTIIGGP